MGFLLDTNVISELRRSRPHGAVINWLSAVDDGDLFVAAVTIGELQAGAELTREQDAAKAAEIAAWIDQVVDTSNVIALDAPIFRLWARLMHRQSDSLYEDAVIAATAITRGLIVATRNLRDFARFDVAAFDPFSGAGSPSAR